MKTFITVFGIKTIKLGPGDKAAVLERFGSGTEATFTHDLTSVLPFILISDSSAKQISNRTDNRWIINH